MTISGICLIVGLCCGNKIEILYSIDLLLIIFILWLRFELAGGWLTHGTSLQLFDEDER